MEVTITAIDTVTVRIPLDICVKAVAMRIHCHYCYKSFRLKVPHRLGHTELVEIIDAGNLGDIRCIDLCGAADRVQINRAIVTESG